MTKDYKTLLIELQRAARRLAIEADEWLHDTDTCDAETFDAAIIAVERLTQGENYVGDDGGDGPT